VLELAMCKAHRLNVIAKNFLEDAPGSGTGKTLVEDMIRVQELVTSIPHSRNSRGRLVGRRRLQTTRKSSGRQLRELLGTF
jgi:hypothetical protein